IGDSQDATFVVSRQMWRTSSIGTFSPPIYLSSSGWLFWLANSTTMSFTVADQMHVELARLTQPVCFANDLDRMLLEGSENALYGIHRFRVLSFDLRRGTYA